MNENYNEEIREMFVGPVRAELEKAKEEIWRLRGALEQYASGTNWATGNTWTPYGLHPEFDLGPQLARSVLGMGDEK